MQAIREDRMACCTTGLLFPTLVLNAMNGSLVQGWGSTPTVVRGFRLEFRCYDAPAPPGDLRAVEGRNHSEADST